MTTCHQKRMVRDGFFWRPERTDESSEYGSSNINNSSVYQVSGESIQERIRLALDEITTSDYFTSSSAWVAQFWAPKVIGERCYLTTSDQPFCVRLLDNGSCQYRRECMNYYYITDNEAKEEEVGPPGRVFRSGHPESSFDLRLYSVKEFPLRDQAARYGFTTYLALPLFDLCRRNQCIGVLEIVTSHSYGLWVHDIPLYHKAIKEAQLRSTHDFKSNTNILTENTKYMTEPQREIREMLQLAIQVLPQLNLVQVWAPCNTCTNSSNHLNCMERLAFIIAEFGNNITLDKFLRRFLDAGRLHNLQAGKGIAGIALSSTNKLCFCRNLSSLSIVQYPLAHYAQKANLSFVFSICLRSVDNENDLYVFEFYLHSHIREDAHTWSFLHLLLKIMEMQLKSFKVESGRQLGDELIVEVCTKNMLTSSGQEPSNVGYEIIQHGQAKKHQYLKEFTIVMPMARRYIGYSISDFIASLKVADLSFLKAPHKPLTGWLFCSSEVLSEAEVNDNSLLLTNPIQEKIKTFFTAMASKWFPNKYCLLQFWAPKITEGKSYLSTSDQPFVLGILCEGLYSYRKWCMEHHYFIDEGAKEEELGPPGRVFRIGYPESSPDLRLYSVKEFSLRDHATHCGLGRYLALPVFDSNQKQCVGILEFVENGDYQWNGLTFIGRALKEAHLMSTPFCFWESIQQESYLRNPDNDEGRKQAFLEIHEMLSLVIKSPELCLAQVWVPCIQCSNKSDDWRCMKRAGYRCDSEFHQFNDVRLFQIGKGVAGMALGSENRSCFCRNLCDFSITEQPLAHYAQRARLDICFAICLQSSHTDNTLYALEFFLRSGIVQGGYPQSLYSLLLIMKQKLKSFKVASGQELGEELVVDVIESGKEKKLSESTYTDIFPIRFNIIQSSQEMEHEHSKNKQVHYDYNGTNISEAEQSDVAAAIANKEVITNKTKRSRKETSFHIDRGDLEPHFGKRLEDVARELGVGKSTVKRACRKFGIERWPGNEKNKKNPSLFLKEKAVNQVQVGDAETSISIGTSIPPLDLTVHQSKPRIDTESTQQLEKICPETDVIMMVKAKFKDDTIKFQLRVSSGLEKLKEEVNKRLYLKIGSFKLKYLDEGDDDWILLGCEDDLQLCVKTLTALGKTCIQVMVQLINP